MLKKIFDQLIIGLLTKKSEAPPIGSYQTPLKCRILNTLVLQMQKLAAQSLSSKVDKKNTTTDAYKYPIFLIVEHDGKLCYLQDKDFILLIL